ncbi:hypothetical protein QUF94_14575 [Peribacillus sp. NJ4]|nr:hypothetical protein [Peribacillus sp. NJ4]MDM5212650.1 hypothetical protein [Peribacillus sp. NJ4]
MKQFIYDMIHMSEGEKFIHYWWLWPIILVVVFGVGWIKNKGRK